MAIPRHQRQWDIYRANLGESPEVLALVLSSDETNRTIEPRLLSCEIVPESLQPLAESPVTIRTGPEQSGLSETAVIDVTTMASLPRGCLVSLEGRLESVPTRVAVLRAVEILVGLARWP